MVVYTAEMAHADVARGAEWLDKRCPNWFAEIDLAELDLANGQHCILGQTAKCLLPKSRQNSGTGYWAVLSHRRIDPYGKWVTRHGFHVDAGDYDEEVARFEMLTIAWTELIRKRLAKA